jgi:ketosteroid isomerase-like protein
VSEATVRRHIAAVQRGDLPRMSADYAPDAVIDRGSDRLVGRDAIAAYFATVPARLGGRAVDFEEPVALDDGSIVVRWHIAGTDVSGRDRFVVRDGLIAEQYVELDNGDF